MIFLSWSENEWLLDPVGGVRTLATLSRGTAVRAIKESEQTHVEIDVEIENANQTKITE